MRGPRSESELVEAPPHRAEIRFSLGACCPLPARGARKASPLGNRSKNSETARDASYRTPSFFCRLEDEVVYWNTRRLFG
jgi:hypothetical protein